jgi:predicted nucleotidyltransferase
VIAADARTRVADDARTAIVTALARRVRARAVILCGSRATGAARPDSDYDVLVVLPVYAIPWRLGALDAAAHELEAVLGAPVSINPVPSFRLRRPGRTLLVWKARAEGVVLAGDVPARPRTTPPPLTAQAARSYALSGLRYLIANVEPADGVVDRGTPRLAADVRKALLHAAQLRLLERGRYARSIAEAGSELDPDDALELERLVAEADTLASWRRAAEQLLPWVGDHETQPRWRLGDLQYLVLSVLARRRPYPGVLLASRSVRVQLASAVEMLVRAVGVDGAVQRAGVVAASACLPRSVRTGDATFTAVRDALEREWPLADPLVGL